MTTPPSDCVFTDEVAKFYDTMLVPLIFEPYAKDLAARVQELEPNAVLEVACGTGVVTRALARVLPPACTITATDLNSAMIDYGKTVGSARAIAWRQADATTLPYADATFDVVVCQFGAMFFPDRVAAYREIRRVLRPRGSFLFNVWGDLEINEFTAVVCDALRERYPRDPPQFMARTPHGHGCVAEIESEVSAAGFTIRYLSRRDDVSAAPNPEYVAIALCQGTPLRNEIEAREPGGLEDATAAATAAVRQRWGDGPIRGRISAIVVRAVH